MKKLILISSIILASVTSQGQSLINLPAEDSESAVGSVVFDNIEFGAHDISSHSVHGKLKLHHDKNISYITCITTESGKTNINYISTYLTVGNNLVLGNFGFESFEKCKLVAMKIASNPGKIVKFKAELQGKNNGKVVSVEWQD